MWFFFFAILQVFCAQSAVVLRSDIIKGTKAAKRQFPYQVSIRHYGSHICGGSILNLNSVASASHCFTDPTVANYLVVAGITNLKGKGILRKVSRIILSKEITNPMIFDIAVVKVAQPFLFNALVAPIPLDRNGTKEEVTCIASGWGLTSVNGSLSQHLLFVNVKTMTNEQCQAMQPHPNVHIFNSHLCTSTAEKKGVCQGDSGGPLQCEGVLSGITSFGWPCALGAPDMFVRVQLFTEYVEYFMNQSAN